MTTPFDWERRELHVEAIQQDLKDLPWVFLEPGGPQGDLIHDPFGKTIHGSDSRLEIGSVQRIGQTAMAWHAEPVPTFARILSECSRAEAQRLVGGKLAKRRYYYEVLVD